jgi:hypothetical protein
MMSGFKGFAAVLSALVMFGVLTAVPASATHWKKGCHAGMHYKHSCPSAKHYMRNKR